jgi:hypothetical protein
MNNTPEYEAYYSARNRCNSTNATKYLSYGGRGIKFKFVAFDEFFRAVGPRPSPQHSLDRIDNNGNYEVGNVRWSTYSTQRINSRVRRSIENFSDVVLLAEIYRRTPEYGLEGC